MIDRFLQDLQLVSVRWFAIFTSFLKGLEKLLIPKSHHKGHESYMLGGCFWELWSSISQVWFSFCPSEAPLSLFLKETSCVRIFPESVPAICLQAEVWFKAKFSELSLCGNALFCIRNNNALARKHSRSHNMSLMFPVFTINCHMLPEVAGPKVKESRDKESKRLVSLTPSLATSLKVRDGGILIIAFIQTTFQVPWRTLPMVWF